MNDEGEAAALVAAIRAGDVAVVQKLVDEEPGLASSRLGGKAGSRTPLHIVTDWPGFFPNGPAVVRVLIAAGADPNARDPGKGSETPLHWAASSDDVEVASALIEGGADIEAADGSIGTPLDNAVGYACWDVARLLVARGAEVDALWHSGGVGSDDPTTNCSPRARPKPLTSRRPSGMPAPVDNAGRRNTCSPAGLI